MLHQLVSLAGALLVLGAYLALQTGRLGKDDLWFGLMNVVGSLLLTWVAIVDRRVGFILLEGAWALISVVPLLRRRATT